MTRARLTAALVALVVVAGVWCGTPAYAAEPTVAQPAASSGPAGNPAPDANGGLQGLLPDPRQWADDVFSQVLVTTMQGLTNGLRSVINSVLASSLNFISQTPPAGTYDSPTVQSLWGTVRNIANAALALVALWGGLNVIVRQHLGSTYHDVMEMLPRYFLGALLVNTSSWWVRLLIDLNNALCGAVGQASLPAWQQADTASQALANVLAALVYIVAGLILLLQMLMRLALIDIFIVAAPIGLLCWVLPQTESWARLWWGTFTGAVFVQFVQVLALKLGASLMTELAPMFADAALLAVFLGIAVVTQTLRIPGIMHEHSGGGFGFGRYVAFRQGAHFLESRGGSSSSGAAASGAAAGGSAAASSPPLAAAGAAAVL